MPRASLTCLLPIYVLALVQVPCRNAVVIGRVTRNGSHCKWMGEISAIFSPGEVPLSNNIYAVVSRLYLCF
jgi:hypothetical protein